MSDEKVSNRLIKMSDEKVSKHLNNNSTNDNNIFNFRKRNTSKLNIFDVIKNELDNVLENSSDSDT